MSRQLKTFCSLIAAILIVPFAHAQVSSTFNANDESWTFTDNNNNNPKTVTFTATGGNPGGYVSALVNSAQPYYWTSPVKYKGDRVYSSYGLLLKFDLQASVTPTLHGSTYGDVVLEGNGTQLCLNLTTLPDVAPAWSSYALHLDESEPWRYGSIGGALATKDQVIKVLTSLNTVRILGQYTSVTNFTSGLDNVVIEVRTLGTPPSITNFSPKSGKAGESIVITGTNFSATASNNIVVFGGIKGTVTAASATQLTVTIPNGASVSPIAVTNIATGLTDRSASNFTPTWGTSAETGGRIIRASFKDKVDFLLETPSGHPHFSVGDLDGDGWNDVLVTESNASKLSLYRNAGNGGNISTSTFDPKVAIPINKSGKMFNCIGDLDGDGKPDIVVGSATTFNGWVGWIRNLSTPGNLSFEPMEELVSFGYVDGPLHLEDIDGDGLLDIIALWDNSCGGSGVYMGIYHNASKPGNIEFSSYVDFDFDFICPGSHPSTGDLTGDGKPEIIVARGFGGSFGVFENTSTPGNISFNAPFAIDVSGANMLIADFDGDGKNDIASSGYSTVSLNIRKNNYSGGAFSLASFGANIEITSPIGYIMESVVASDFNGDGKIDIALMGSSDIAVFENVSTPGTLNANSFVPGVPYRNQDYAYPYDAGAADLNGDGKPEIIGSTNSTSKFYIYENVNTHAPVITSVSPLKGPVGTLVTITGDHFSAVPGENIVYFGGAIATVETQTKTSLTVKVPSGARYAPLTVTRNGLTAQANLPFTITFSPGTAFDASSFLAPVNIPVSGADYDVDIGDIDFDGKPDILIEGVSNKGYIFKNVHTGTTITASSLVAADTTNTSAENPRLLDIDGDGKLDISSSYGIYQNITNSPLNFANAINQANGPTEVSWADFNHDGKIDITGAYPFSTNVVIYENQTTAGPFTTGNPTYLSSFSDGSNGTLNKPSTGGGTASADFDGDGFADIAASNPSTDNIRVWLNSGGPKPITSNFTTFIDLASGDNPGRLTAADLDVDGKVDLVVYNYSTDATTGQSITVYHNQSTPGNLSFNSFTLPLGSRPSPLAVGDLDGDGRPEIVVTSESANRFSIFKNISAPGTLTAASFSAPVHTSLTGARAVAIGDLNGDGKPELVFSRSGNLLTILENAVPSTPTISFTTQPAATTVVCDGTTVTLNVVTTGTTNIVYQWQKFNTGTSLFENISNGGAFSGATTATLTITTNGGVGSGDYRCKATGDNAPDAFSSTATVTVNSFPAPPTATGDTNCVPATFILTAAGSTNGSYRWYNAATGGSSLGSNGTFTTPLISTTTTYYVSIANASCESTRTPAIAEIKPLNKPSVAIQTVVPNPNPGDLNLCEGQEATLTAPAGFTAYAWSTGSSQQAITVNTTNNYTVTVTDSKGCVSPASDPVVLTVHAYPVAIITASDEQLSASAGDSYQWYFANAPITGATSQTYAYSFFEYGVYAVDVTTNGCSTRSDDFVFLITAAHEGVREMMIFPNPFDEELIIESPEPVSVTLTNATAQTIYSSDGKTNLISINTSSLSSGIYFLSITTGAQTRWVRVMKR